MYDRGHDRTRPPGAGGGHEPGEAAEPRGRRPDHGGQLGAGPAAPRAQRSAPIGARGLHSELLGCPPPMRREGPLNEVERAAYEAAMTENMLLRAVLDDPKGAGSHPASMSNRRKCELGERLRAATGRPLREITAFLRISRSSCEYWRAGSRPDKYAALRGRVRELFEEGGRNWGYRTIWARLRREGRARPRRSCAG